MNVPDDSRARAASGTRPTCLRLVGALREQQPSERDVGREPLSPLRAHAERPHASPFGIVLEPGQAGSDGELRASQRLDLAECKPEESRRVELQVVSDAEREAPCAGEPSRLEPALPLERPLESHLRERERAPREPRLESLRERVGPGRCPDVRLVGGPELDSVKERAPRVREPNLPRTAGAPLGVPDDAGTIGRSGGHERELCHLEFALAEQTRLGIALLCSDRHGDNRWSEPRRHRRHDLLDGRGVISELTPCVRRQLSEEGFLRGERHRPVSFVDRDPPIRRAVAACVDEIEPTHRDVETTPPRPTGPRGRKDNRGLELEPLAIAYRPSGLRPRAPRGGDADRHYCQRERARTSLPRIRAPTASIS